MDSASHKCQCGCNQPIPAKPWHRFRHPRYLLGHASRDPEVKLRFSASHRRSHIRPETAPVYRCQCGCNEEIKWKPYHAKKPPKFIQQHYLRDDTTLRVRMGRIAKSATRMKPPEGWKEPTGTCECGCGQTTKICTFSRPQYEQYIGYPKRWIHGHHSRAEMARKTLGDRSRKDGRYWKDGYIYIHMPGYQSAQRDGYIPEHRYVYETTRGVKLTNRIIIHHINGIKDDNRPENLVAYTRNEHSIAHIKASQVISLFLDDRLLNAAKAHVREHGELPDLESLTKSVYGHAA